VSVAGAVPGAADVVPAPSRERRWVALGDSFTAGISEGETTWAMLAREHASTVVPTALLNLAAAGATVADIERDQLPIAVGTAPDLVTLICGGNDVIGTVRPRPDVLAVDLERIFATVAEELPRARRLTATYPPIFAGALRPRTRARIEMGIEALNDLIREAANRHGFACAELAAHPGRVDAANYAADGVHPSAAGHRAAAAVLGPAVTELIADELEEA
jgi:lysophospholipase L1-like esterase